MSLRKPSGPSLTAEQVIVLAAASGVRLSPDDAEAVARALFAHSTLIEPMLAAALDDEAPWLVPDPRWRD